MGALRGVGLCFVTALLIGVLLAVSLLPIVGVALAGIIAYGLLHVFADKLPAGSARIGATVCAAALIVMGAVLACVVFSYAGSSSYSYGYYRSGDIFGVCVLINAVAGLCFGGIMYLGAGHDDV